MTPRCVGERDGFALVLSILLVLTLALATLGMVAVATRETTIAHTHRRVLDARLAAESEARRAFARWSTRAYGDLAIGETRSAVRQEPTGHIVHLAVERLDSTTFLLDVEARGSAAAGAPTTTRAGLLVRTVDLDRVGDGFLAALAARGGALLAGGDLSGLDACAASGRDVPGVIAPVVRREPAASVYGQPAILAAVPEPPAPPDPLAPGFVSAIADVVMTDMVGTPRPAPATVDCATDPWSWGGTGLDHPCGVAVPIVFVPGDLVVRGGEARAILVVAGDLTITDGALFDGLIVVGGGLRLDGAARIRGAIRAGQAEVLDASVRFDSCVIRDALADAAALDRAFRPPGRWWIPVHGRMN